MLQIAASTIDGPSLRRFAGIQAVATYSPGGDGSSHRSSVSMALKAIAPSRSSTLIFGKTGFPSRSTVKPISIPIGSTDVDDAGRHPVVRDDPDREDLREVVAGSGLVGPRRAPSRRCAVWCRYLRDRRPRAAPSSTMRPPVDAGSRGRRAARPPAVVRDEEHRPAGAAELLHPAQAAPLELGVADREHLVDEQDLGLEVRGDGEREPHVHAARVALHRRVDELLDARELDDLVEARVDLAALHPEDRAVQVDVLAAGQLGVEARADLEQAPDAPADLDASPSSAS